MMIILFLAFWQIFPLSAQENHPSPSFSQLINMELPGMFVRETNPFSVFAGETILKMEADAYHIQISQTEIFIRKVSGGTSTDSEIILNSVLDKLKSSGWQIYASQQDQTYKWLCKSEQCLLGYFAANRKEINIYLGKSGSLPTFITRRPEQTKKDQESTPASPRAGRSVPSTEGLVAIAGNWGNLNASQINYYDPSGTHIGSGLSKGYGFEFKSDGSFTQSFLATSSFPNYKIFIYTTGHYTLQGDQLILIPEDRHYRKWERNVITTDEHSRPEPEQYTWHKRQNPDTGKICLYLTRAGETEAKEYCHE